ncbi:MAG: hypothetical protein ABIQ86_10470 [Steroidobacteraceae bacterium]
MMKLPAGLGFLVPEKRKAGQFVRPNFDKTPNWYVLSQAPNPQRSCASHPGNASVFTNSFGGLATIMPERCVSFRFQLPRQAFMLFDQEFLHRE